MLNQDRPKTTTTPETNQGAGDPSDSFFEKVGSGARRAFKRLGVLAHEAANALSPRLLSPSGFNRNPDDTNNPDGDGSSGSEEDVHR